MSLKKRTAGCEGYNKRQAGIAVAHAHSKSVFDAVFNCFYGFVQAKPDDVAGAAHTIERWYEVNALTVTRKMRVRRELALFYFQKRSVAVFMHRFCMSRAEAHDRIYDLRDQGYLSKVGRTDYYKITSSGKEFFRSHRISRQHTRDFYFANNAA